MRSLSLAEAPLLFRLLFPIQKLCQPIPDRYEPVQQPLEPSQPFQHPDQEQDDGEECRDNRDQPSGYVRSVGVGRAGRRR